MQRYYDAIYFSPHLDDAILSCGGQIGQKTALGQKVLIVTITAGDPQISDLSPFAVKQHTFWGNLTHPVAMRRAEDEEACRILGADWDHWRLLDCIYRRDPETRKPLYASEEAIFGELHSADLPYYQQIIERLYELPESHELFCPLGIGNHVDHQWLRRAAEHVYGERLGYYEDYPYVQREAWSQLQPHWMVERVLLNEEARQRRIDGIKAYHSQMGLFGGIENVDEMVQEYIGRIGGERIWRKKHNFQLR